MTRDEEIENVSERYGVAHEAATLNIERLKLAFHKGAKWADETNPMLKVAVEALESIANETGTPYSREAVEVLAKIKAMKEKE